MALQVLIGCHVLAGLVAVVAGATTMLTRKGPGRHPRRGHIYLATLTLVFTTGTAIAATNWAHLWHLASLGAAAVGLAGVGYAARRRRWRGWLLTHIMGMAGSYTVMLTAFYVDNGPRLPLWRLLPPITFWFLPAAVATPLIANALRRRRRGIPGDLRPPY